MIIDRSGVDLGGRNGTGVRVNGAPWARPTDRRRHRPRVRAVAIGKRSGLILTFQDGRGHAVAVIENGRSP
jgi:hypothetical protein